MSQISGALYRKKIYVVSDNEKLMNGKQNWKLFQFQVTSTEKSMMKHTDKQQNMWVPDCIRKSATDYKC